MSIKRFSWMTILEVMIAITLFGTGILVILSMITKNISRVYEVKQRDAASLLAKEGLEVLYNLRDSNIDRWIEWSCAAFSSWATDNCSWYFYQWNSWYSLYTIDLSSTWRYTMQSISSTGSTRLYLHTWLIEQQDGTDIITWFWYTHNSGWWVVSDFRRYLLFKPMSLYPTNTGDILYVASYVEYNLWSKTKSVVLESLIGSSR